MKRAAWIIAAGLLLFGCERAETVSVQTLGESEGSEGCTHAGICMTCMPGFDGKMDCGMKFSPYCPGNQAVRGTLVRETYRYPSKPEHLLTSDYLTHTTPIGECS